MRIAPLLLLAALVAAPALAQSATQDVRLRLVSNDAVAGGNLVVAVDVKTTGRGTPNSLGSATIDVDYQTAEVAAPSFTPDAEFTTPFPRYNQSFSPTLPANPDPSQGRIQINGMNASGNPDFDVNVGETWTPFGEMTFELTAVGAVATTLVINRATLSIGYYDSEANTSGNGIIEDNTGTVGDDVIPFVTVGDLSTRTAVFGSENWHIRGMPGTGATLGDLVGPLWTQGFPGSDAGTIGETNVAFWVEALGDYAAPTDQGTTLAPGLGAFVYAFPDDDFDGTPESFPKNVVVAVDPTNDLGAPVVRNGITDPYVADLPFTFSMTFTPGSGAAAGDGWNLLANPADSTANWDAAGWTRTDVSDAFATWDAENAGGAQYVSWSSVSGGTRGSGFIAPFEGFWARATGATPVLTMPEAAYGAPPAATRTEGAPPAVRLRLAGDVGGLPLATETLVAFVGGATPGLDRYDGPELAGLTSTRLQLFARTDDGEALDIDVRGTLEDGPAEVGIDLHAIADDAWAAADLVLTWPELRNLADDVPVQLLDTETGTIVDLRTATEYAFSVAVPAAGRRAAPIPGVRPPAMPVPTMLDATTDDGARTTGAGTRFVLFVGTEARAVSTEGPEVEATFDLAPPMPNPVRDRVTLRYGLDVAGPARIAVYDMLGRQVALAADGEHGVGPHQATLSASSFAAGVYVVRLDAGGRTLTRTLTVVR